MKLNDQGLAQKDAWAKAGIEIPSYDRKAMADATCQEPRCTRQKVIIKIQ